MRQPDLWVVYVRRSYNRADSSDIREEQQEAAIRALVPTGTRCRVLSDPGGHQSGASAEREGDQELLALVAGGTVAGIAVYDLTVSPLSSIAYDDRCGQRIAIHACLKNGLQKMCGKPEAARRHSGPIRVEGAARDLDTLIGNLHLADPVFLSMVEQELKRFTSDERTLTRMLPDPEIARIDAAVSALGPDAVSEMRAPIVARLRQLRGRHEERGAARSTAIRRYRASIDGLRNWGDVWTHADARRKNELLKLAGVTVRIGRRPGAENGPASLLSIEAPGSHLCPRVGNCHDRDDAPRHARRRGQGRPGPRPRSTSAREGRVSRGARLLRGLFGEPLTRTAICPSSEGERRTDDCERAARADRSQRGGDLR